MSNLTIILRTCDRVDAFSGNRARTFGPKNKIIKKCVSSLASSINYHRENSNDSISFIIVDDHSSLDTVTFLKSFNHYKFISVAGKGGNGASFEACVNEAKNHKGLIFFVEDDYLLEPTCINEMVDIYERASKAGNTSVCVHPTDYPDRYKAPQPALILLGKSRHWRTIDKTTCTFMIDDVILSKFANDLIAFKDYGIKPGINEDVTINKMYKAYPCLSPIPSLAEHYQYPETLSPFYKHE